MQLPELPKGKNRREAKIDGRVAQWFFDNYPRSILLEVKMEKGRLKEHQKRLINKLGKEHKFKYKFRDGAERTPLDYVILKEADAVLAICDEKGNCECIINNKKSLKIKA